VEVTEAALEPPVPGGLGDLSGPLKGLADFLCIDRDLMEVIARASIAPSPELLEEGEWTRWIEALPPSEENALLLQLAKGERHIRADLLQRFRDARHKDGRIPKDKHRTVAELLATAEERRAIRRREAAEREAQEGARREREEAAARAEYLEDLERRQEETWMKVDALIETKQPQKYDQAVVLLKDLGVLAMRSSRQDAYRRRLAELQARHARKPTLIGRMNRL